VSNNKRNRIPSKTVILPPGKAMFAVTHPNKAENKWDPTNPQWSIRVVWEGEARKKVEQLLGPMVPEALEAKKAELIAEAREKGDMIKEKKAEAMESETPWREVLSKETAEPTGEIEIVFKRPAFRTDRSTDMKVPNSPPATANAQAEIVAGLPIPNRSLVAVKMATWPVYFASDNKAGIKRLLESVQLIAMPEARKPDASGFQKYEDNGSGDDEGQAEGNAAPANSGADY
jgi:hypothetical protein